MTAILSILKASPFPLTARSLLKKIGDDFLSEYDLKFELEKLHREGKIVAHGESAFTRQMLYSVKEQA